MKNGFANLVVILVGTILVFLALGFLSGSSSIKETSIDNGLSKTTVSPKEEVKTVPVGTSTCGIYFTNLEEDQSITSPFVIKGNTDGCGWFAFEGVIGTAKLYDLNSGDQVGDTAILSATTDWMTEGVVYFEAELSYEDDETSKDGYIIFTHDNAEDKAPLLTKVVSVKY